MGTMTEKFKITVTDSGEFILSDQDKSMRFTAGEALMVLDILKSEEGRLRRLADEASPIPIKLQV
jgi:hypothetical protein